MKNQYWEAVHQVYSKMESLCGARLRTPDTPLFYGDTKDKVKVKDKVKDVSKAPPQDQSQTPLCTDDVVNIRTEMRTQLDFLRATVSELYSERDVYLIIFPIVAHIDELIQTSFLREMQTGWPLLQKELFKLDNAGEVFYEIIDDILLKPQTPVFIFEIYYFCLSYGFRGRYEGNPVKVKEYMKKLQSRLQQDMLDITSVEVEEAAMGNIGSFNSPYMNYLIAAGAILGVYLFFIILGKYI